jgi:hypothetical protein
VLVVLARLGAAAHPDVVERLYARGVYPPVARLLSLATGFIPFSLAELLAAAGVLAVLAAVGRLLWSARKRPRGRGALRGVARLALASAVVVLAFDVLWGYNYERAPVSAMLGYDLAPGPPDDLAALSRDLLAQSVSIREGLPEDEAGALRLRDGRQGALKRSTLGYEALAAAGTLPLPALTAPPKLVLLSPWMSYLGISGIFIPFTCEANVNGTVPDWEMPFTAAHELAHQRGFAREDEANYVGYLACLAHPDRDFQYSGAFRAALYTLGALARADRKAYGELRAGLAVPLRRDLAALFAWQRRYESRLGDVQDRVNDAYLKTQGQADGVQSYGRMVDLLLAERRARAQRQGAGAQAR